LRLPRRRFRSPLRYDGDSAGGARGCSLFVYYFTPFNGEKANELLRKNQEKEAEIDFQVEDYGKSDDRGYGLGFYADTIGWQFLIGNIRAGDVLAVEAHGHGKAILASAMFEWQRPNRKFITPKEVWSMIGSYIPKDCPLVIHACYGKAFATAMKALAGARDVYYYDGDLRKERFTEVDMDDGASPSERNFLKISSKGVLPPPLPIPLVKKKGCSIQ